MTLTSSVDTEQLESFAATFGGVLLTPADDGYAAACRVHNGLIDRKPAVIARCSGTADVAAAVRFARQSGLEISVRGGGHNVAGRAVTHGGVMIDLSLMKGIHVDAEARTARAQGGVLWSELNRETAVHGLAVTGGRSRPPGSPATRWEAGSAGSCPRRAWEPTTSSACSWSPPRARCWT